MTLSHLGHCAQHSSLCPPCRAACVRPGCASLAATLRVHMAASRVCGPLGSPARQGTSCPLPRRTDTPTSSRLPQGAPRAVFRRLSPSRQRCCHHILLRSSCVAAPTQPAVPPRAWQGVPEVLTMYLSHMGARLVEHARLGRRHSLAWLQHCSRKRCWPAQQPATLALKPLSNAPAARRRAAATCAEVKAESLPHP